MSSELRINVVPDAQDAIREAIVWWRNHRPKAPDAVVQELRRAFRLLRVQPSIGSHANNPKLAGVRRVHLSRIRYHLYYRVNEERGVVDVLALWHSSRSEPPTNLGGAS